MTLLPTTRLGTVAVVLWLLTCFAVLAGAWIGRQSADTGIFVLYAMLVVAFPVSLLVNAIFAVGMAFMSSSFGITVQDGFALNLLVWLASVVAGYVQWVCVVPRYFGSKSGVI